MLKKRCGQIKTYQDWCSPKIVENALELLEKEIPKYKKEIKLVYLCFSSDPFMYKVKEVNDLSLKIIERLSKDKIKVVTITKGLCPPDLINIKKYGGSNEYGITLVSLSEEFRKKYEPFAAPITERIRALKNLHDKGLKTWISMEPYPTPNIFRQNIYRILKEISFVNKIVFGRWNYNSLTSDFGSYKSFYNFTSEIVNKYCRQNGIECHIKDGTMSTIKKVGKLSSFKKTKESEYDERYREPFFAFG
jgi:DNA repair photolyase